MKDKIQEFIKLVYGKKSQLLSETDVNKRKLVACKQVGLDIKLPEVKEIVERKNVEVNQQILEFTRMQKDLKFATLQSAYENHYNTLAIISEGYNFIDTKDLLSASESKQKLTEGLKKSMQMISELATDVFFGDAEMVYALDDIGVPEMMAEKYADVP